MSPAAETTSTCRTWSVGRAATVGVVRRRAGQRLRRLEEVWNESGFLPRGKKQPITVQRYQTSFDELFAWLSLHRVLASESLDDRVEAYLE